MDSFAYALAEDGVPDTVSGNALAGAHPGDGNNIFAWVTPPSAARYGSISLNPDGTFTYTIDNSLPIVQELGVGDQVVEHFIYTYTDAARRKSHWFAGHLDHRDERRAHRRRLHSVRVRLRVRRRPERRQRHTARAP